MTIMLVRRLGQNYTRYPQQYRHGRLISHHGVMRAAMKMLAVIFLVMLAMTATFVEEASAEARPPAGRCRE